MKVSKRATDTSTAQTDYHRMDELHVDGPATVSTWCRLETRSLERAPATQNQKHASMPTLLNAACSLLLANYVGQDDVVFGNVMDTRGAVAFPGIETTLGPCLNINPLRVRLDGCESTTFAALCHSLSEQYVQVAGHAAAWDLPDIVEHCTDWPADTQMGCIINHLRPETGPPPLGLNGAACMSLKKSVQIHLPRRLLFRCIAARDRLEVQVLTSAVLMDPLSATRLAERLVAAVTVLSEAPGTLLADVHV